jgi:PAS domain S-box-containing protein
MKDRTTDTFLTTNLDTSFSAEEALSLILNNLEDTFILINKELRIIATNEHTRKQIRDYFGIELEQGMSVLKMADPSRYPQLIELYKEVFRGKEQRTEILITKDGESLYFENHFKPALNIGGEIIAVLVTSKDITETKKTTTVLKEIEERWRFALEGGRQSVWDWNMQTGHVFYSDKKLYGYDDDRMDDTIEAWLNIIHEDDRDLVRKNISIHTSGDTPFLESRFRIRSSDGSFKWILSRGMIIGKANDGTAIRMIGTHTDITEQVHAEELVRTSEKQYRTLFHANPLPCWIFDADTLQFLQVNQAAIAHYGYGREEFLQSTILMLQPEDQVNFLKEETDRNAHKKSEAVNNWVHCKKNGEKIYVDLRINAIDFRGKAAKLVVAHDVTAKVDVETELRKSNERFTYAAKASSEALWEWTVETNEFYISQAYTDIFGWKTDSNRKFEEWHDYIHPDDRDETIRSYYAAIADKNREHWSKEYRYRRSDASYAFVHDKAIILRNEQGEAIKVVGAIQDITNQKTAEEELRKSNERFVLVSKATSDAIYDWDITTEDLHWGEGMHTLFGYEPGKIDIPTWETLIHPGDRPRIEKSLSDALANPEKNYWKEEYLFSRQDGSYSYVLDRGFIIRDNARQAIRMIGSMQDITDRRYHEKLLSLERFIFELSTNPNLEFVTIIDTLLRGLEDIHEDAYTSVVLLRDDETLETLAAPRLPGEYLKELTQIKIGPDTGSCGRSMSTKQVVIVDDINKDSLWQDFRDLASRFNLKACWSFPIIHTAGKVLGSFAVYYRTPKAPTSLELTTMERMRNMLRVLIEHYWTLNETRVANERFDIMMRATHDLIWDWNLETNIIYRDEIGLRNVYGLESNEPIKGIYQWLGRIHPDDQLKAEDLINDILRSVDQDTFDIEYRFKRDDGSFSHVYDRGMIIRNADGKPIRMIGAAQDVTERKRLEQELLQNELERQKAINQATVDTQEQERSEIGKELHDNVNQVLTTTKLYLDLALTNEELKDELISKSNKNIVSVINEIRQLSRSLMDPSIGDLGLIDTINDLIDNINLTRKLHVHMTVESRIENQLNQNQKLTVFRIIQEALNNAIRHAKASSVSITFKIKKKIAEVVIEDNGIGFQPGLIKRGAGLKNIQNRIYLINGTQEIYSAPGKGCKIIIKFPTNK